ncbi:MAG: hypothetical protein K5764_09145 [Prevotella sp.]|nr:hypothetical protein [Prevotella sp.]
MQTRVLYEISRELGQRIASTTMQAMLAVFCSAMLLTACSEDDNPTVEPGAGPLAAKLNGVWYAVYDAEGTAQSEDGQGTSVAYDAVIDIYNFGKDGTGTLQRCFFNDNILSPALVQGSLGYGDFTYTSQANGKVSMALVNKWNQTYPQAWEAEYADETLKAKGVDGRMLTLELADEPTREALNVLTDQNGSGTAKYDVNDYKPKGVDNSQWMKTLADSRLVAALSLPGSHDACTAEGWHSEDLAPIYELTAKCQDLTIAEQLKVGVRVFDLRPERSYQDGSYVLRCAHGIAHTKMLVADFFRTLQQFLAANPSEFCLLTVDLSATYNMKAWGKEFTDLLTGSEFKGLFVDFKPRLTVGEMRGKVLILSRKEYAAKPIGGYCYGWVYDLELSKQTQGHITASDGSQTPLWVQDYWGKSTRDGKDEAVVRMLEAAAARDLTVERPAWVINYPSAYFSLPLSDNYRSNATSANVVAANWLESHDGPVGIIYMDYAGMNKTVGYAGDILYDAAGMRLVEQVIKQNTIK